MNQKRFENIDEYHKSHPPEIRVKLNEIRALIHKAAPEASEKISYNIPTFFLNRNLVHYAGYKNHIGFYPGGKALSEFPKDIQNFKYAKGSIQFPLDESLPTKLIERIVKFRLKEEINRVKESAGREEKEKSNKVK